MHADDGRRGSYYGMGSEEETVRDEAAIVADYLAGVTVPELARRHRHTNRTIARILRSAGVLGELQHRRDIARRGRPSAPHLGRKHLVSTLSGPQWAYIAGLFDGDGSLVVRRPAGTAGTAGTTKHRRYMLSIVQKDATVLEWLRGALGVGRIHFANGTHRYEVAGQRALFALLCALEPHLYVKRTKAREALACLGASYGWTGASLAGRADESTVEGKERAE